MDHRDWAISTVTRAIEKPRSTDERSEILPGSPTMSATSRTPSRIGSSHRGPSRSSLGSRMRQDHRGEDRARHVPARFPDDPDPAPRGSCRSFARAIPRWPDHARLRLPSAPGGARSPTPRTTKRPARAGSRRRRTRTRSAGTSSVRSRRPAGAGRRARGCPPCRPGGSRTPRPPRPRRRVRRRPTRAGHATGRRTRERGPVKQVSSRVAADRTTEGEVELGPGDVLLADRKGSVVRGQPARGRDRESHVVDRDPHRQVGVEPDPERCRLGGGVRRTRDDLEPVRREPILEAQLEPPWVRGLRVQDALQRDRFVGPGSEPPGEPTHEPVDRVPELGLVDRGRPPRGRRTRIARRRDGSARVPAPARVPPTTARPPRSRPGHRRPPAEYDRSVAPTSVTTTT